MNKKGTKFSIFSKTVKSLFNINSKHFKSATSALEYLMRKTKINTRLIISFLLVSIIPILLIGALSYSKSSSAIKSKIETYGVQVVNQISQNISMQLNKNESICNELISNSTTVYGIDTYLKSTSRISKYSYLRNNIVPNFAAKFSDNPNLVSIFLKIHGNETELVRIINVDNQDDYISEEYSDDLDKLISGTNLPGIWTNKKFDNSKDTIIYVKNSIPYNLVEMTPRYVNFKLTAYFVFDQKHLSEIFKDANLGKGVDIFVVDSNGMVISSKDLNKISVNSLYNDKSFVKFLSKMKNKNQNSFNTSIQNKKHLVTYSKINGTDWYVVSTIPYTYLQKESVGILWNIVVIALVILVLLLIISFLITFSISIPLKRVLVLIDEASKGNLYVNIKDDNKDEISELVQKFNSMVNNIGSLISKVNTCSYSIVLDAGELASFSKVSLNSAVQAAAATQQITQSTLIQLNDASECVDHVSNLSTDINQIVNNINCTSDIITKTKKLSDNTLDSIETLNLKALQTHKVSESIIKQIYSLNTEMKEIRKIIKLIVEIVEQTKLLSLNASIEAAKAGDSGKGFAVVAQNIKKLADRSKSSLASINGIVNIIQDKTGNTVNAAAEASNIISQQLAAVSEVDKNFQIIYNAMEDIIVEMNNSQNSLNKALYSKDHMLKSIEHIHALSSDTAASTQNVSNSVYEQKVGSEQLANLSIKLNDMSQNLNKIVEIFKLNDTFHK